MPAVHAIAYPIARIAATGFAGAMTKTTTTTTITITGWRMRSGVSD